MSERGSFVTEYIYCNACFEAAKNILKCDSKFLRGVVIPGWSGMSRPDLPIIAGKIGGAYPGEELHEFEHVYQRLLSEVVCHPMRVAVLADSGERIFVVQPITPET